MSNWLIRIYSLFSNHRKWGFAIVILIFVLLGWLASKISFEEDITKLIPSSEKADIANKVINQVKFTDKIIVNIEAENASADKLVVFADSIIAKLETQCSPFIEKIQGKIPDDQILQTMDFVYNNLPVFLNTDDYKKVEVLLRRDSIKEKVNAGYKTLISPTGFLAKQIVRKDPLGMSFLALKKFEELQSGSDFELYNNYLITKDHKNLLLFVTPALGSDETAKNTLFIEALNTIVKEVNSQFSPDVSAGYFGAVAVAVANANQIKNDIKLTLGIALTILLLLLIYFYKKLWIPFILFLPPLFGGLLAVACLYLIKGEISAISLGIGSVLLGITIDYALHILTHYRNNHSIVQLYKGVASPTITSSVTTAIAFLCLIFLKSEALRDLGIFASISVLGASVFALIIIPQLYRSSGNKLKSATTFIDKIAAYPFHKSKAVLGVCLVLFVVSLFTYKKVSFESDISKMNYQSPELTKAEQSLDSITNLSSKSIYLVNYGEDLEEALKNNKETHKLLSESKQTEKIINYSSLGSVVLSVEDQHNKIDDWNRFWTKIKLDSLKYFLIEEGASVGFRENTFSPFYQLLEHKFNTLDFEAYQGLNGLLLDEYISEEPGFATITSTFKVKKDMAKQMADTFSELDNLVVIDRQHLKETFLGNLKNDFNGLVWLSLAAIMIVLLVFFSSPELTLLTCIPIILSWLFTLGIMGLFDIRFNIFNIIISTFVFGLGIDYSIFITNGLLKEYKYGVRELSTYKTSIILSAFTTVLGVGALIFAKHPALKSISLLSISGILSAVLVSFTIQPLLFNLWFGNRQKKGRTPWKLWNMLTSFLSFSYYALGSLFLTFIGTVVLPIIPVSNKVKMKWFHQTMSGFFKSVVNLTGSVKIKIHNKNKENFDKPAVIIANHTSFLDTLSVGMLHPKMIFLVNDWVHNSPIFGKAVQKAGFYPVSKGIENGIDHIKTKLDQGYSIVVFPEGTRSETNKIKRFHKGAFYLADQFKLDILPILLQGNSDSMPKSDFMLKQGVMNIKLLDRIAHDDKSYGNTYSERTKKISTYFKRSFNQFREEKEPTGYFKNKLLYNYLYKGRTVYNNVKKDYHKNKEVYKRISERLGKERIAHLGSDYGQLIFLLAFRVPERSLLGYDRNPEQIMLAMQCYSVKNRKISFTNDPEVVVGFKPETIIISGGYLPECVYEIKCLRKIVVVNSNINSIKGFDLEEKEQGLQILCKNE